MLPICILLKKTHRVRSIREWRYAGPKERRVEEKEHPEGTCWCMQWTRTQTAGLLEARRKLGERKGRQTVVTDGVVDGGGAAGGSAARFLLKVVARRFPLA